MTGCEKPDGHGHGRSIRVLHVIDSFDLGGAQEAILQLAIRCDSDWITSEVAALHGRGIYFQRFREAGIVCHSLSPSKFLPFYVPALIRLIVRRRFDVVHCHLIASNLVAKPIAALLGVPVRINHDHSNDSYRGAGGVRMYLDRLANHLSTHVCAVSASTRDFLLRREKLPPSRVTLIYNGTDLSRYRPPSADEKITARRAYGLNEAGIVVGGVGRLNYQKNFSLFLEVAARLRKRHPHIQYILAGDGPERNALEQQVDRLDLRERVRFAGLVRDMASFYPVFDILLMPSRFEGLPLTLLEAMAMEIPAVASAVDGVAEIVENERDGILVQPGNVGAFEEKLEALIAHPRKIGVLGRAAREKIVAHFSCERMTRAVEALYRQYIP